MWNRDSRQFITAAATAGLLGGLAMLLAQPESEWLAAFIAGLTTAAAALIFGSRGSGRLPDVASAPVEQNRKAPDQKRIAIDALDDPALLLDRSDQLIAANAAAIALFGRDPTGELLPLVLRSPQAIAAIQRARATGDVTRQEIGGIGSGQESFLLHAVGDPDGEDRLLLRFTSTTEIRQVERMRADFVANASHELRTPLATLIGFIETLQSGAAEDPGARARFLGIMAGEAERMTRLIDDLLSLSRVERDKYVRPTSVIDLKPLFRHVGETLAIQLKENGRALVINVPEDLPKVVADQDQILQVMHNLLSNSLKYGRAGTPIALSASPIPPVDGKPGRIEIEVADQGEGIAPEHLPRLTERFYRVDTGRSRKLGGTGLGLAIVRHIVERHRGRLRIESRRGTGTTVRFDLPQAVPAAAGNSTSALA